MRSDKKSFTNANKTDLTIYGPYFTASRSIATDMKSVASMKTYTNGIYNRHSTTADRAKGYYGQDRYPRSIPQPLILLNLELGM